MKATFPTAAKIVLRVTAIVVAGYGASFVWVVALALTLSDMVGLSRADAVVLSSMLGFLIYLAIALCTAAQRQLWRAVALPLGCASLGIAITYILDRAESF